MAHIVKLEDRVFNILKEHCLKVRKSMPVDELIIELMDYPDIPMHFPYHHFIMPAALLTIASIEKNISENELSKMLDKAIIRSKNVLGGFCGDYGACGAGVGAGIFLSIFTDTSPMSGESFKWVNELTGICLQALAKVSGPRCCKRSAFLSIAASVPYINEKLNLNLKVNDNIICKYSDKNQDCKKENCPFFYNK